MMMYGDSAIEEELEDLGDEFAAECAANSLPSVPGTVIHQDFYNAPTTSSSHLIGGDMYYQQAEPQGGMYVEHSYAQVHEPVVMQQQYQEWFQVPYTDPMASQQFAQQIYVTSSQSVHQPYDQVMYTNGHCYAQEEPVYHPQVAVGNGPVIQQVFEPVQLVAASVSPVVTQEAMMAQQVQHLAQQSALPRARIIPRGPPPLPGRQFQANQNFRRVENPALQQQTQLQQQQHQQQPSRMLANKPVPEGVRVLRHRVVGRPLVPPSTASEPSMPLLQAHAPPCSTAVPSPVAVATSSDPSPSPVMNVVVTAVTPAATVATKPSPAPTSALPSLGSINKLPPIPKKKRPEAGPVVASVSSTEVAQAGAIQRIATEEGWKQMNAWLKNADKENKLAHLKDLLRQCHQANISVQLLTSNDSPKFVRKLSKTHADSDVRQAALACVTKWKKEIADPTVPAPAKKTKKEEAPAEEKEQPSAKPSKTEAKDAVAKKAEKRRLSDEAAKSADKSTEKAEKKNKTKAKVFSSKSRLTGLVDDLGDSAGPDAKKKKKEEDADKKKASEGAKKKEDEVPAKPAVKKLPPIPKKVSASSMSSGFMDALSVSIEPKKKPAPKRRPEQKKEVKPVVNDPLSSVLDCLIGDKKVEPPRVAKTPTPPPVQVDDPDMAPPGNRKIRFADECGKELTMVREFQIEEGERINVNRMSAEDMKHHEMMMERKWKEESGEHVVDEPEEEEPVKDKIPWRLLPIDNLTWPIERGSGSEEKDREIERRKNALRAFNHPNFPSEITGDPDNYDPVAARMDVPPNIPLNSIEEAGQEQPTVIPVQEPPKQEEKKITLPDNLQNLLDGLKKKGIVGGGPGPAAPTTTLASMVSGLSSLAMFGGNGTTQAPAPVQIPQNNPYGQVINASSQQQSHIHQQMPQQGYGQFGQYPQHHHQQQQGQGHHMDVDRRMGMHQPGPSSAPPRGPPNNQCHQWAKMGRCKFGDRCRFAHDNIPGNAPSFRGGRGDFRGGRGGFGGGWRGDDRRGGYRNNGPPRRDYHDRRGYDSPPYASPSMHSPQINSSPSIRSPPGGNTPNDFDAVAIPSERLD